MSSMHLGMLNSNFSYYVNVTFSRMRSKSKADREVWEVLSSSKLWRTIVLL